MTMDFVGGEMMLGEAVTEENDDLITLDVNHDKLTSSREFSR